MILNHGPSYVPYNHDYLIYVISPTPNSFVMRIVTLDERVIGVALLVKIPFIDSRPASQRLHLNKCHALVTRWEAGNERFVEVNIIWNLVLWRFPFTSSSSEVKTQATF